MSRKIIGVTVGTNMKPQKVVERVAIANAIITKHSGETIVTNDSAKAPLQSMKVFGKSVQNTVSGRQRLQISSNLSSGTFTQNGITATVTDDGNVMLNGKCTQAFNLTFGTFYDVATMLITLSGMTDHTIYVWDTVGQTTLKAKQVGESYVSFLLNNEGSHNVSVAIPLDATYNNLLLSVMVNITSEVCPWEPYVGGIASPNIEYPQDIHSRGENGSIAYGLYGGNLFNVFATPKTINRGASYDVSSDGRTLTVNSGTEVTYAGVRWDLPTDIIKQLYGKKLSLLGTSKLSSSSCRIIYRVNGANTLCYLNSSFIVPEGTDLISLYTIPHNKNEIPTTSISETWTDLRLVADEQMEWSEYKEPQSLILQTPNGLNGLPVSSGGNYTDANGQQYLADVIYLARGKKIQYCKYKRVLSSLNWLYSSSTNRFYVSDNDYMKGYGPEPAPVLCTHFKAIPNYGASSVDMGISYINDNINGYAFRYIALNGDVNAWKTFLADNEVYVLGLLKTPIETDLTEEEIAQYKALMMNYPNTTILNDANAYTEIEQVSDTKIYVDNKFKELEIALANTNAQLL